MITRFILALLIIVGLVLPSINTTASAAALTLTVDTLVDETDGSCSDGDCSLRDAIQAVNPGDTVNFSVTGTILLGSELTVDKQLTIQGPAWNLLTISGNQVTRVFNIANTGNLTLKYLTIRDGIGAGMDINSGGGIYNAGTVTAIGVVVVGNKNLTGHGGAIGNWGTLTVISSSISNNIASGDGAGIDNHGTLDAQRTTFFSNSAAYGAGIKNENGTATVSNCTFYANHATYRGGGVDSGSGSTLTVTNSTFFANTGGVGLGNPDSTTIIINSIVASNSGGDCSNDDFTAQSNHNLSTDASCNPGFTQVAAGDLKLTWDGFHVLIGVNSAAVDAGTNEGCPTIDQKGTPRPWDGNLDGLAICDVGSDELKVFAVFMPLTTK